jgi:hypothetical protein
MIFGDNEAAYLYQTSLLDTDFIPPNDDLAVFDMSQCLSMA